MGTPTTGLRERKKAATRLALHRAAVNLATEVGLDRVTVEAIADAAMVSRRTFSNYFSSKEEALLYGDEIRLRCLIDQVRAHPAEEPAWTALTMAIDAIMDDISALDPAWMTQQRPLRRHPHLVGQHMAMHANMERDLADSLLPRIGPDPQATLRARVTAATFLTTVRVATRIWLDDQSQDLPTLIRQALAVAAH